MLSLSNKFTRKFVTFKSKYLLMEKKTISGSPFTLKSKTMKVLKTKIKA